MRSSEGIYTRFRARMSIMCIKAHSKFTGYIIYGGSQTAFHFQGTKKLYLSRFRKYNSTITVSVQLQMGNNIRTHIVQIIRY